jgi:hypothetical protein
MPQPLAEELKSIPMSSNLGASLERAHRFAREQSHRSVTLEHLLLALVEDPEAALILQSANVDLARLGTEVSGYLGRLLEDMRAPAGGEPRPDPELLRVLQAAASAAQQSRRRHIDGAIVLAAIVGDAKSPAAAILKALGMTFEEAIRALQRANAKARLQPKPQEGLATAGPVREGPATSATPAAEPPYPPSAEEILAAARARIQQRSGAQAPLAEPPAAEPPMQADRPDRGAPGREQQTVESLSSAIEAAMEPTPRRIEPLRAPPPPSAPPAAVQPQQRPEARAAHPPWTTQPEARAQGAAPRAPNPQPARPGPLPSALRPAQPPWGPGERRPQRPAGANGAITAQNRGPASLRAQEPHWTRQRAAGGERGPLVESIPRRMRDGVAATGEVRIARDKIEALMHALSGPSAHRPGVHVVRALSVRLRAPQGGFAIEAMTPETQWIDGSASPVHDDSALWRWGIRPQRRGRGRLLLTLSARTVGTDAVAAESAPPDRVIDVRVGHNYARLGGRLLSWAAAIAAGVLVGRFGEQAIDTAALLIRHWLGG